MARSRAESWISNIPPGNLLIPRAAFEAIAAPLLRVRHRLASRYKRLTSIYGRFVLETKYLRNGSDSGKLDGVQAPVPRRTPDSHGSDNALCLQPGAIRCSSPTHSRTFALG